ncbi:hypothetical protein BJV77DRAFT_404499 [Russula vinacea]|nr:hypothetical protein BJV77DRAFT_404499 [Russula vinacea]
MNDRCGVSQSFGNFWCPQNAIIFKDICGRLRGESIVKASLGGTSCGFCKRLLVSTVPRASRDHRGIQPIITEGCPWMGWKCSTSCLLMHSSVDIGLGICTGQAEPDSPLLVSLAPMSEQPGYSVVHRTHIHLLDNDSLLQIFSHYRLENEDNWNLRQTWRNLVHVCRRWRNLIYDSSSHLDVCLLLMNDSPSIDTLGHLPPLPLVIDFSDRTETISQKDEDNIHLGLQQHGLVRRVVLEAQSSSLRMWLELMKKHFPRLRDLSLFSTTIEEMNLTLPETLQVPDLRRLSLHGVGLPKGLSLLSSVTALSTLSLTQIRGSCCFSPRSLVTQLQDLPHLEELSIGFAISTPLPSSEGELLPVPIAPVTLPTLRRLTFRGRTFILTTSSLRSTPHFSSDSVSHLSLIPLSPLLT